MVVGDRVRFRRPGREGRSIKGMPYPGSCGGLDRGTMLAIAGAEVDAADHEQPVDTGKRRGKRLRSIEIERSDLRPLSRKVADLVRIARPGDDAAGLLF